MIEVVLILIEFMMHFVVMGVIYDYFWYAIGSFRVNSTSGSMVTISDFDDFLCEGRLTCPRKIYKISDLNTKYFLRYG